jgi:hypothetical protein
MVLAPDVKVQACEWAMMVVEISCCLPRAFKVGALVLVHPWLAFALRKRQGACMGVGEASRPGISNPSKLCRYAQVRICSLWKLAK